MTVLIDGVNRLYINSLPHALRPCKQPFSWTTVILDHERKKGFSCDMFSTEMWSHAYYENLWAHWVEVIVDGWVADLNPTDSDPNLASRTVHPGTSFCRLSTTTASEIMASIDGVNRLYINSLPHALRPCKQPFSWTTVILDHERKKGFSCDMFSTEMWSNAYYENFWAHWVEVIVDGWVADLNPTDSDPNLASRTFHIGTSFCRLSTTTASEIMASIDGVNRLYINSLPHALRPCKQPFSWTTVILDHERKKGFSCDMFSTASVI